ncbi:MAG: hypothetical protein HKN03_14060 [Acidimicrobiales bacterium]|nr:hypothetical protein [Acidimicrobiales bacterium]
MADDLEVMMRYVEGEGPSPEFVATLRERIVAETASPENAADDERVFEINVQPPPPDHVTTTRRQWILVAVATIIVIVGFLALSRGSNDRRLDTVNPPEEQTTSTVTTSPAVPATFATDAPLLTEEFGHLEPGNYRVDTLGTPFTFTLDQPQALQDNHRAHFVLSHPGSQGSSDRDITFMRLSALSNPAEPTASLEASGEGWPADDFAGWLDTLTDEIVVSNRESTTFGGLKAIRADLQLGETDCRGGEGSCVLFGTNNLFNVKSLSAGSTTAPLPSRFRIWVVEQDDQDPLAVIVGINRESDQDWFDTADTILSTLAFGDIGPNPILDLPAGRVELPFVGGVRTELSGGSFAMLDPQGFGKIVLGDWEVHSGFLSNPLDSTGNVLETPDDLVAALEQGNETVTEVESIVIDGINARVFDVASASTERTLMLTRDDGKGWHSPARGRIWVIDHPDRGLLMLTAEAFENVDMIFPLVLAQTEAIIESLEFIELG